MDNNTSVKLKLEEVLPKPMVDYLLDNQEAVQNSLNELKGTLCAIDKAIKDFEDSKARVKAKIEWLSGFIDSVYGEE